MRLARWMKLKRERLLFVLAVGRRYGYKEMRGQH